MARTSLAALLLASACANGSSPAPVSVGPGADQVAAGDHTHPAAVLRVDDEPVGANCAYGGRALRRGADANGNGALDAAEVTATDYVCNQLLGPWARVVHEDFENGAPGWTSGVEASRTTACGAAGNVLGGAGVAGAGYVAMKQFTGLPPHRALKIEARAHFLDSWDSERMWMKVDGVEVWGRSTHSAFGSFDACGSTFADKLNVPLEVVLDHAAPSVTIQVGSELDEPGDNESWAIDDLDLSVSTTERGWRLAAHESYDTAATGWSSNATTTCSTNRMLGGYATFGGPVNKVFDLGGLPHSEVRVVAEFEPIDSWDMETAYARLGGRSAEVVGAGTGAYGTTVWTAQPDCYAHAPPDGSGSICGGPYAECDPLPVDGALRDSRRYVNVVFGATLDEPLANESWGVDNLFLWVR